MCAHVILQHVDIARASPAILLAQEKRISELRADQSQSRLIYELEKERVMYRLSSYLKARICKIKRLALYLASPEGADARSHMTDKVRARRVCYYAVKPPGGAASGHRARARPRPRRRLNHRATLCAGANLPQ